MSILVVFLITSFTVVGNLFLKVGVLKPGLADTWPLTLINMYTLFGTVSFGLAFLGYATLLQRIPLNLAQAIFSFQFVAVIVSSAVVLGEPVGAMRWLGICIIFVGILVVNFTATIKL
jgi:drug/metabolite transporter (DMT)-like permease